MRADGFGFISRKFNGSSNNPSDTRARAGGNAFILSVRFHLNTLFGIYLCQQLI